MAQRLFLTSTSSSGQKEEWWIVPLNFSMPGQSGMYRRAAWGCQCAQNEILGFSYATILCADMPVSTISIELGTNYHSVESAILLNANDLINMIKGAYTGVVASFVNNCLIPTIAQGLEHENTCEASSYNEGVDFEIICVGTLVAMVGDGVVGEFGIELLFGDCDSFAHIA
ncbi:hypothetical protein HG530_001682 [Fusarium avenaceum]|nr:hypothetical protein HG530_001682 [Fusarium avenaceum]